ncbi:MAG TPA: hypothetical protein VMP11_10665 [Verrucomicrobiae bacterium]|nr:hypothetical protein [Verrucomicrobiae bacterium]
MSHQYGTQTKPVQRSLVVLDMADAVEYVHGSSVRMASSARFCVKLRKGFEVFAPDGDLFIRSATKLHHAAASLAKGILAAKQKAEREGYPASVTLEEGKWQ